jgi:hypothetical protein
MLVGDPARGRSLPDCLRALSRIFSGFVVSSSLFGQNRQRGPDLIAAAMGACATLVTMTVSVALRRNDRINRCTIECCLSPNVVESISASRRRMASAVICGSIASQFWIAARCG